MGFRPQPRVDDSLIQVTNNPNQQKRIASSLRLFRDSEFGVFFSIIKNLKFFFF